MMTRARTPGIILALTLCLMAVGLTMVYSASANKASGQKRAVLKKTDPEAYAHYFNYHDPYYLRRQALFAALGLAAMLALGSFDHHRLRRLAPWLLAGAFVLLCLVFFPPLGRRANGASRWIGLGPFNFQPSEAAKLVMVIYMARMLVNRQRVIGSFREGVVPASAITAVFCFIILIEPDFGTAAILAAVVFLLWFIAGMRLLHLAALVFMVTPLAVLAILTHPHMLQRVLDLLDFWSHDMTGHKQLLQSVIAVASGGLTGRGIGCSIQKYAFLPEAHTDFIFAVMAEELGFIRSVLVILVFLALIIMGWRVALRASDTFGGYLASGVTLLLALSVSLNLLVVLGCLPPKGMALPFMSYGGSSMLVNCAAIGILINVAKYNALSDQPIPRRQGR